MIPERGVPVPRRCLARPIALTLLAVLVSVGGAQATRRVVLGELFEGAGCPYCPSAVAGFNDLVAVYSHDFLPITWYTTPPYGIPEGTARHNLYGDEGVPHAWFDGYEDVLGGISSGSMFPYYDPVVADHLTDPSPLAITAIYRMAGATAGTLDVHIEVASPVTTTDNIVHFVIVEDGIAGAPNMARDMLPDENFALTTPGETVDIVRTFNLDPSWVFEDLAYVVFVQTHSGNKKVLQAARAAPGNGVIVTPAADFVSSGEEGGPFAPETTVYTVENVGDYVVDYEVSHTVPWITVTNASGTLPAHSSVDVTVEINMTAQALGTGTHTDVLAFTNTTDHFGDTERAVTLKVGTPVLVHSVPLDSDPRWFTVGDWAFGQPTGEGGESGYPDPTSGHTGGYVYGYNLDGDYDNVHHVGHGPD